MTSPLLRLDAENGLWDNGHLDAPLVVVYNYGLCEGVNSGAALAIAQNANVRYLGLPAPGYDGALPSEMRPGSIAKQQLASISSAIKAGHGHERVVDIGNSLGTRQVWGQLSRWNLDIPIVAGIVASTPQRARKDDAQPFFPTQPMQDLLTEIAQEPGVRTLQDIWRELVRQSQDVPRLAGMTARFLAAGFVGGASKGTLTSEVGVVSALRNDSPLFWKLARYAACHDSTDEILRSRYTPVAHLRGAYDPVCTDFGWRYTAEVHGNKIASCVGRGGHRVLAHDGHLLVKRIVDACIDRDPTLDHLHAIGDQVSRVLSRRVEATALTGRATSLARDFVPQFVAASPFGRGAAAPA